MIASTVTAAVTVEGITSPRPLPLGRRHGCRHDDDYWLSSHRIKNPPSFSNTTTRNMPFAFALLL